jgi:hypothetical protein
MVHAVYCEGIPKSVAVFRTRREADNYAAICNLDDPVNVYTVVDIVECPKCGGSGGGPDPALRCDGCGGSGKARPGVAP